MTYAESRAQVYSPAANYTVVPPPRTPVGPSMDQQRKSKMKNGANSLDYWNKAEDEKSGITYYYSRHNIQFPQRLLNRTQPPSTRGRPTLVPQRFPPFPQPQGGDVNINIMSPQPPPPPPVGIYKNVPAMPRAKLNKEYETRRSSNGGGGGDGNVVWGGKKEEYNEDGVGTSANTPMNPYSANDKKRNTARRKPRWTRCMQTLFCCVTPPREIEKIQSNNRTSTSSHSNGRSTPTSAANAPIQLITQVHRDGTVTGLPTTPLAQNGSGDVTAIDNRQQNDLSSIIEKPLLPPLAASDSKKKCLVIDLDETLVHSSFKPVKNPDFVIPVEIDGVEHQVYVLKRPYVDEFLARVGEIFECILFTASLAKYADPVADLLDKKRIFRGRLFREACVFHKGNYVKDLSRLGRDLNHCLIIDNSPASYAFHPENAVPVTTWFDDPGDRELLDIIPALESLNEYSSVYDALRPEEGPMSESLLDHCSC